MLSLFQLIFFHFPLHLLQFNEYILVKVIHQRYQVLMLVYMFVSNPTYKQNLTQKSSLYFLEICLNCFVYITTHYYGYFPTLQLFYSLSPLFSFFTYELFLILNNGRFYPATLFYLSITCSKTASESKVAHHIHESQVSESPFLLIIYIEA